MRGRQPVCLACDINFVEKSRARRQGDNERNELTRKFHAFFPLFFCDFRISRIRGKERERENRDYFYIPFLSRKKKNNKRSFFFPNALFYREEGELEEKRFEMLR